MSVNVAETDQSIKEVIATPASDPVEPTIVQATDQKVEEVKKTKKNKSTKKSNGGSASGFLYDPKRKTILGRDGLQWGERHS
jgi:hypothetical protein